MCNISYLHLWVVRWTYMFLPVFANEVQFMMCFLNSIFHETKTQENI